MDDEPVIDSPPFDIEPPKSQAELLRDLWRDMKSVKVEVKKTNGRVTRLERVLLGAAFLILGYLVAHGLDLTGIIPILR